MSSTDIFDDEVVDLFAGPGGWDVAARRLGFDPRGIEFEHNACETRRAAGFPTIKGDVRDYGPGDFPNLVGLIGSPPCQTFSMAGKGAGRAALDDVLVLLRGMAVGVLPDYSTLSDDRTGLVLDPLRWVLEAMALGRPLRWVVLEQVPTVLPVWQAYAEVLRGIGYRVETAVLHAEQYGVPQSRKRAVLVARYNAPVSLPTPTHSRYYSHDRTRLDLGVLPWVSMAQALNWNGPAVMRSNYGTGGDPAARGERMGNEPAPTITSKIDRNKWIAIPGETADEGRVTVEEAAALQSFPADHPWQGSKGKQYQQIGNAVPPLLAEAVLRAVLFTP